MKSKILNKAQEMMGGSLAVKHTHELLKITGAVAESIGMTGERHWYGISMDTGGGKSTVITATALVTHEMGIDYPILVAVPNLQSMAEMYDRLITNGYPKDLIGKVFSACAGSLEEREVLGSVTLDYQLPEKKILLVCHQRMMGHRDWLKYKKSQWGTRSCFWDEAVNYGESFSCPKDTAIAKLQQGAAYDGASAYRDWFVSSIEVLKTAKAGDLIVLDDLPHGIDSFWCDAKKYAYKAGCAYADYEDVDALVKNAGADIRVQDDGLLHYTYRFTDDLQNLFVFDAGHKHSELSQLDARIIVLEAEGWKHFRDVTIYQSSGSTSQMYIEKNRKSEDFKGRVRKYLEMIGSEPFIVLTKKAYVPWLKEDYGFTNGQIVTYGLEQGVNKYGNIKHVLVIGLNRLKLQDMEAKWLLYSRDIKADYSKARPYVEQAALLQFNQGVSRTSLRNVKPDPKDISYAQAGAATIYMIGSFKKEQQEYLRKTLMPDCKIIPMDKGFDVVHRIEEIVDGKDRITLRDLWREVWHTLSRSEKNHCLGAFLAANDEWEQNGRTLERRAA